MPKFKWMLRDDHPRNFIPATGPSAEHADTPCGQHGISRRERWLQCQNLIVLCRRLQHTYVAYIAHVRLTTPEQHRTLAHFDLRHIEPSDYRPRNDTMAGLPKSHCAFRTIAASEVRKYNSHPFYAPPTHRKTRTFSHQHN